MGAGIEYGTLEELNIELGDGGNAFTIEVLGLTGLIRMHDGVVLREPARDEDFD